MRKDVVGGAGAAFSFHDERRHQSVNILVNVQYRGEEEGRGDYHEFRFMVLITEERRIKCEIGFVYASPFTTCHCIIEELILLL